MYILIEIYYWCGIKIILILSNKSTVFKSDYKTQNKYYILTTPIVNFYKNTLDVLRISMKETKRNAIKLQLTTCNFKRWNLILVVIFSGKLCVCVCVYLCIVRAWLSVRDNDIQKDIWKEINYCLRIKMFYIFLKTSSLWLVEE